MIPCALPDIFDERYAAVIVCSDPDADGVQDAYAYGPEEECPYCEEESCRSWELYVGAVYYEPDRRTGEPRAIFDEHAAVRAVGDCRGPHDDEPRDERGQLMRP